MRRLLLTITSVLLLVTVIGCGANKPVLSTKEKLEIIQVDGDRIVYNNISDLVSSADLIVIGQFEKTTSQELKYEYSAEYNKDILVNAISTNEILVQKVLKGNINNDTLKISQRYGVIDELNQLITFSEMTQMEKGDQWIFFLKYDDINDTYWCSGDYSGRYPVPNEALKKVCDKVITVRNERSEWLSNKEMISAFQAEEYTNKNKYVYATNEGIFYSFESNADLEKMISYNEKIDSLTKEINAADFGLYKNELINLELYCDILAQYDCSLV